MVDGSFISWNIVMMEPWPSLKEKFSFLLRYLVFEVSAACSNTLLVFCTPLWVVDVPSIVKLGLLFAFYCLLIFQPLRTNSDLFSSDSPL